MNNTNQIANFGRKKYVKPQIRAYQMMPAEIICTSGGTSPQSIGNEEYDEISNEITNSWF